MQRAFIEKPLLSFGTYLILSIVTFGFYPVYHWLKITKYRLYLLEEILRHMEGRKP